MAHPYKQLVRETNKGLIKAIMIFQGEREHSKGRGGANHRSRWRSFHR